MHKCNFHTALTLHASESISEDLILQENDPQSTIHLKLVCWKERNPCYIPARVDKKELQEC